MGEAYEPSGFALDIFRKRYALHEQEKWGEACARVAAHVASAERPDKMVSVRDDFERILLANQFMPGGRIWYGSGRPKGQLLNCFVVPAEDSREGWGQTVSDMIVITGTGGGLGVNCSPVRPKGSPINGSGGVATGAISLMQIINAAGEVIKAGGGRRTALMLALGLSHGDVIEFLDKKLKLDELNNANVSVIFDDDPEEFFDLVKRDAPLELKSRGRVVASVPAREVWSKIIQNALKGGEPGVLNGYLANRMNNIWYDRPLICTNPCGEIWLAAYDCCCLGALVLPRFVANTGAGPQIDWKLLSDVVKTAVRFLDDVLTVNNYPLAEIKQTCSDIRRVGLGIMGLHDMLLMMGMRYADPDSLELIDKVMSFIKNEAYEASIELAKEKGAFPRFDAEKFLKGGFAKTLKPTIRAGIKKHGIRNCALLTIAPTGTTAIVCDVTSGIECVFGPAWRRRYRDGDELKDEVVIHPLFRRAVEMGWDTSHFQTAHQLDLRDHFEVQRACQRHLDNACSKTINVPQGVSSEDLSELYVEFLPDLKGVTVYPDGSRENQPITPLSEDEAFAAMGQQMTTSGGPSSSDACRSGVCEV